MRRPTTQRTIQWVTSVVFVTKMPTDVTVESQNQSRRQRWIVAKTPSPARFYPRCIRMLTQQTKRFIMDIGAYLKTHTSLTLRHKLIRLLQHPSKYHLCQMLMESSFRTRRVSISLMKAVAKVALKAIAVWVVVLVNNVMQALLTVIFATTLHRWAQANFYTITKCPNLGSRQEKVKSKKTFFYIFYTFLYWSTKK